MRWLQFQGVEHGDAARAIRSGAARVLVLGACALTSAGCGDAAVAPEPVGNDTPIEPQVAEPPAQSHLRLRNETELDLESVTVERRFDYGALAAGEQSGYLLVENLYATAMIEAVSGGLRLMYVPVDHLGDRPAHWGYYTFALRPAPAEWGRPDAPNVQWISIERFRDADPE